ncbi:MAG TPA: antibiotic biosynthesis monooxygenase [Streptosporangiaceae bacterium]
MIARYWSATTTKPPEEYRRHFTETVVPNLTSLPGFEGCYLLESDQPPGETRFVTITLWQSTAAIEAFAGPDITRSHVEPEGQAALTQFDRTAVNFTVSVHVDGGHPE